MPLLDKNHSLLDNVSDVAEIQKNSLFLMVLKWMTRNKSIVFFCFAFGDCAS